MTNFSRSLPEEDLKKRLHPREEDIRGHYFRDTTAIIHSYPFRRLRHKTQVFFSPKNDHICTRIEHVMHVATVSATICRALGLNGDLAWAISLGHDLGHPPFGHEGERIVSSLLKDRGGFIHEQYALRVVDCLINYGRGINLTYAVRDGIASHCGERFEQVIKPDFSLKNLGPGDAGGAGVRDLYPSTWEGAVVRMSDKIAYLGRDMEDALQLKLIRISDVPEEVAKVLGTTNSDIIDTLVNDIITRSPDLDAIGFSDRIFGALLALKTFNYRAIYRHEVFASVSKFLFRILSTLFSYLLELFVKFRYDSPAYRSEGNLLAVRFGDFCGKMRAFYESEAAEAETVVLDYIAGMTDDYALESIREIMIPSRFELQLNDIFLKSAAENP
ncbi:MAG: HD domain-containing protein [Spirochaetales bacterium]|nr:MAG: HD domain-containing protein [Spirochaetales bacterium]